MVNRYPPLDTPKGAEVVRFVQALTGADTTMKVAFGTEGGLFSRDLGVPTVVCGPGSMAQGHKADEFVALSELDRCDAMLAALTDRSSWSRARPRLRAAGGPSPPGAKLAARTRAVKRPLRRL